MSRLVRIKFDTDDIYFDTDGIEEERGGAAALEAFSSGVAEGKSRQGGAGKERSVRSAGRGSGLENDRSGLRPDAAVSLW